MPEDAYDERRAYAVAAAIIADYVAKATAADRLERERRARGVTFRELSASYLEWLEEVRARKARDASGSRIRSG
ncbi:MAG TPA: hypothetical protein VLP43_11590 [Solirubrobacteraceae bacterium]|nr:hypothetical protein [Solirubrobacteraceae bacterium]